MVLALLLAAPLLLAGHKAPDAANAPEVLGSLDPAIIDSVVKRHLASLRYCYEHELLVKPALAGKIVEHFEIEADGRVSIATTKSTTMNDAAAESCIREQFKKIRFPNPAGGGRVVVDYPLLFAAESGPAVTPASPQAVMEAVVGPKPDSIADAIAASTVSGGREPGARPSPDEPEPDSRHSSVIVSVIKGHFAEIRACGARARAGKIVIHFVVEGDGRVSSASTRSSTLDDKSVETCIEDRFKALRFPQTGDGSAVTVNFPIELKSAD